MPLFHASLSATLRHPAPLDRVFPLLCPVQEALWLPGWSAEILHSVSGVAELGCVFRTHDEDGLERIWTVTRHEPRAGRIQFVQFLKDLCVIRLDLALEEAEGACASRWTYTVAALVPGREAFFSAYGEAPFRARMARLEALLATYLSR